MNITQRPIYQKGRKPAKVKLIRDAARDMTCKLALPGICRLDPHYTVGAHLRLPWLSGGAQKSDDLFIMDCCDACHEAQERFFGDPEAPLGWDDVLRALTQTQMSRRASGLILLKGE